MGNDMKKLFLTLALVVCWAVTAFAAGQINGLTLDNIEEKLIAFNKPYNGTWSPQLAKEDPAATWYSLRACLETHLSIMKRFNSMLAMAI